MLARIKNIMQIGREYVLTLTTSDISGFEAVSEVDIKKVTKKRSLSANAYFHVLSGMIADKLGVSKAYAKNFLLGRYGQRETDDNGNPITLAVRDDIDIMEREDIHTVLVGYFYTEDGEEYRTYEVVRGSHTYTTEEMAVLINGAISEAKEIGGIEVLPPHELERMGVCKSQ